MKIQFEHDFQQKIMVQTFTEPTVITSARDVQKWRSQWMQELKSWHSPYKAIIDCQKLKIEESEEVKSALQVMMKFFEGLFLKSAVGFSDKATELSQAVPFEIVANFEEAQKKIGVRGIRAPGTAQDFRATIQFQNHFPQHVIELSFSEPIELDNLEKLTTVKGKLTNNLMQWHSKWSLLVDCTNLTVSEDLFVEWEKMQKYFVNFFLKACIGYSPQSPSHTYPFKVFRARHKAVAELEAEGNFMGNEAHCRSSKPTK